MGGDMAAISFLSTSWVAPSGNYSHYPPFQKQVVRPSGPRIENHAGQAVSRGISALGLTSDSDFSASNRSPTKLSSGP